MTYGKSEMWRVGKRKYGAVMKRNTMGCNDLKQNGQKNYMNTSRRMCVEMKLWLREQTVEDTINEKTI